MLNTRLMGRLPPSQSRLMSTLINKLSVSVNELPMREAIRYKEKNMKFTATQLLDHVTSHAAGLLEWGVAPGDTIGLWLPDKVEKHVSLLSCAMIGCKVADIDSSITSVSEVRQALGLAPIKVLVFDPVSADIDKLKLLRKSIPEFFWYSDEYGKDFHSKHFPSLQLFIHTGFDIENGALNYEDCFLRNNHRLVHSVMKDLKDDTPFYSHITKDKNGKVVASPLLSHGKALEANALAYAKKILNKEYIEH